MHSRSPDPLQRLWSRSLRGASFVLHAAPVDGGDCDGDGAERAAWAVTTLDARLARLTSTWQQAGVAAGQVLVFRGPQGLAAFLSFWAAQRLGALWLPVDPAWPAPRVHALACAGGAVATIDVTDSPLALGLPALSLADSGAAAAKGEAPAGPDWPVRPGGRDGLDAPAALLPTSGSTGEPKLVVLGRAALARSALLAVRAFGWQRGERLLNLAEPHTMSGLRNAMLAAPLAGMAWLASPPAERSQPFALFECIARRRPQRMVAAPLLVRHANLLAGRIAPDTWHGVRALYCTGADLDAAEVQRFHAREAVPVINYYGLTETVGLCLSQDPRAWRADDASLGHAVGCRLRLVDEHGTVLAAGARQGGAQGVDAQGSTRRTGELQVRQRRPSQGYWRDPVASAALFDGDWLRTGDLACIDPDGRVALVGRRAQFIKTAGTEKVAPAEVEHALQSHAAVHEAAVFGLREAGGAERIAALVVPHQTPESAQCAAALQRDISRHAASLLGAARAPTVLRFVTTLPRAANGKLLRAQLPALFGP